VVTDKKVAFLGALKDNCRFEKYLGRRKFRDGIAIHREDKENVETFKISEKLTLVYRDGEEAYRYRRRTNLERLISRAMDSARGRDITVAA